MERETLSQQKITPGIAAQLVLEWFLSAPIIELEAVEASIQANAPITALLAALSEPSDETRLVEALKITLAWFNEAPLEEVELIESALECNAPIADIVETICSAQSCSPSDVYALRFDQE